MSKSYKHPFTRIPVWSWYIIIVGLIYLSTGCANITSVNHLNQAQQAFNNAVAVENKFRFEIDKPFESEAITSLASTQSGYAAAWSILRQMTDEEKKVLVDDRLWGVKLTLEGLILWRLGKYEEALKTVNQAEKQPADQIHPRDAALLTALPGLIKIDLAYRKILEVKDADDVEKKKVLKNVTQRLVEMDYANPRTKWSAVQHIKNARATVDNEHPVNSYLIQAQLVAYRNYKVAYTSIADAAHRSVPDDEGKIGAKYKKEAMYNLHELESLITKLKDLTTSSKLVNYWSKLCNIRPEVRLQ